MRDSSKFAVLLRHLPRQYAAILAAFGRWILLGALAGGLAGPAAAIFLVTLRWAAAIHAQNPWTLWLLPFAGIAIHLMYTTVGGGTERGNNLLIEELHLNRRDVPLRMAPLGFLAPVITLVFGGSVASVGTAVQMAGALADWLARALRLSKEERRVMLMAGLSGGFGSVIGAPVAGAVFGMEVQSVGRIRYEGIVPCLVSSLVACEIVRLLGVPFGAYPQLPLFAFEPLIGLKVAVAGAAFGLCSLVFIELTQAASTLLSRAAGPRGWLKPALGGLLIIALAALMGTQEYLGMSEPLLAAVWAGAEISVFAFLAKLIFTSLTVGAGFRGGEVTPLFIMGAALGYALAPALGVPPMLLAAVGFVAVFAGASNTPLASTLIGIELFGAGGLIYMLIGTVVSYVFSGHRSIYVTQRVEVPKYMFEIPKRVAVREVMTRELATVGPDAPLSDVVALLRERQVKSVLVLAGKRVLGIITDGDLLRRGGLAMSGEDGPAPAVRVATGKVARDVMTADPLSVDETASLDAAARLLTQTRLKRLPVVDRSGALTGVIARSDILRRLGEDAHLRIETPLLSARETGAGATVRGWMRSSVATVAPDAAFATVLERLVGDPLRRVVVVDEDRHVLGIIIDADLLNWVSGMTDAALQTTVRNWLTEGVGDGGGVRDDIAAEDIMSPTVYTVRDDARPIDVIQTMIQRRVKRLIVVDAENRLQGIIDRHDMLRAMTDGG
ncbi:MAG: chloride channel protein [Thermoflexales bacterium]